MKKVFFSSLVCTLMVHGMAFAGNGDVYSAGTPSAIVTGPQNVFTAEGTDSSSSCHGAMAIIDNRLQCVSTLEGKEYTLQAYASPQIDSQAKVESSVRLGRNVKIRGNSVITGNTIIQDNAIIESSVIDNSVIGSGSIVVRSRVSDTQVAKTSALFEENIRNGASSK